MGLSASNNSKGEKPTSIYEQQIRRSFYQIPLGEEVLTQATAIRLHHEESSSCRARCTDGCIKRAETMEKHAKEMIEYHNNCIKTYRALQLQSVVPNSLQTEQPQDLPPDYDSIKAPL